MNLAFKFTLLSTPVSSESELLFCKATLLRKLLISPKLFGLSIVTRTIFYIFLVIERYANSNASFKTGNANCFSNFLLISEKWMYL